MEKHMKVVGRMNGMFTFQKRPDGTIDKGRVICIFCKKEFAYHRSSSSLAYHIKAKHPVEAASIAAAKVSSQDFSNLTPATPSEALRQTKLEENSPRMTLKMAKRNQRLRALVTERLTAAAEEIFALVERTIVEYEEELCRSKEENQRTWQLLEENQRRQQLLEEALGSQQVVPVHGAADVQIQWSPEPSLQQEIPETPQIKEEPEEQSIKQEEEQLPQFTETSPKTNIIINNVSSLCDVSEEHNQEFTKKGNLNTRLKTRRQTTNTSSLLQLQPAEKNTEDRENNSETEEKKDNSSDSDEDWQPPASTSTAQMETEADGDHYNQVQIKDTSPAAHNSTLFTKYKSAAETRATVRDGHTAETGAGKKKRYECIVCQKRVTTKNDLKIHTRSHIGESSYSCTVCEKLFILKSDLNIHLRQHTGERPYSCTVCQNAFVDQTALMCHLMTHTRPYSCLVCHKSFTHKGSLNVHMRRHTGERPYICTVCQKSFTRKGILNTHMKTHRAVLLLPQH